MIYDCFAKQTISHGAKFYTFLNLIKKKNFVQILNKEKTSLFFSRNTPRNTPANVQDTIVKIAGIRSSGSLKNALECLLLLEDQKQKLLIPSLTKYDIE